MAYGKPVSDRQSAEAQYSLEQGFDLVSGPGNELHYSISNDECLDRPVRAADHAVYSVISDGNEALDSLVDEALDRPHMKVSFSCCGCHYDPMR